MVCHLDEKVKHVAGSLPQNTGTRVSMPTMSFCFPLVRSKEIKVMQELLRFPRSDLPQQCHRDSQAETHEPGSVTVTVGSCHTVGSCLV